MPRNNQGSRKEREANDGLFVLKDLHEVSCQLELQWEKSWLSWRQSRPTPGYSPSTEATFKSRKLFSRLQCSELLISFSENHTRPLLQSAHHGPCCLQEMLQLIPLWLGNGPSGLLSISYVQSYIFNTLSLFHPSPPARGSVQGPGCSRHRAVHQWFFPLRWRGGRGGTCTENHGLTNTTELCSLIAA